MIRYSGMRSDDVCFISVKKKILCLSFDNPLVLVSTSITHSIP